MTKFFVRSTPPPGFAVRATRQSEIRLGRVIGALRLTFWGDGVHALFYHLSQLHTPETVVIPRPEDLPEKLFRLAPRNRHCTDLAVAKTLECRLSLEVWQWLFDAAKHHGHPPYITAAALVHVYLPDFLVAVLAGQEVDQ